MLFLSPGMCGSSVSCCKMPSQPTGVLVDCESTCLLLAKKRKSEQPAGWISNLGLLEHFATSTRQLSALLTCLYEKRMLLVGSLLVPGV